MKGTLKIFILEDDTGLRELLKDFFQEKGYLVDVTDDGISAENMLYENRYDLLLMDVNIPSTNGYELLKGVRERGVGTPAIFITARSTLEDLEQGYDAGCDDYLRKPFSLKELEVRAKTLIKRAFYHESSDNILLDENMQYDLLNSTLIVSGRSLQLSSKESQLLKLLLQSRDEVVTHDMIYDALWGYNEVPSDTSLRTYIKNLRKLIGKEKIQSIKKQGYRYQSGKSE